MPGNRTEPWVFAGTAERDGAERDLPVQEREAGEAVRYSMMTVGIDPDLDYLYDQQQQRPAGWCPICKREIYAEGENLCTKCKEMEGQNAE